MRAALFLTCLDDTLFPGVGKATVTLLERLGVAVDYPAGQTCCGQMHFNSGYRAACMPLVRNFADTFGGYDTVVTTSASCAAMVRRHHRLIDPAANTPQVHELCEFLTDVLNVTDVGARFPHTVALHQTCHSMRLLGIGDRPRRLLSAVRGLELRELDRAAECCGFGGTFSVKNPAVSSAMGSDKADNVLATGAHVLTSVDTSCLMHIGGLLSRRGSGTQIKHLAEILAAT